MKTIVCGLLIASCISTTAQAVPLTPGGLVATTGTTTGASPDLAGVPVFEDLRDFRIITADLGPGFFNVGGEIENRVVRSSNLDTLIFQPRIVSTTNIDVAIDRFAVTGFRLQGFGDFTTDVDFLTDGPGDKGPTAVSRSLDGDTLDFFYFDSLFIDNLSVGLKEASFFPTILTDATNYATTGSLTVFGRDITDPDDPGPVLMITVDGIAVPIDAPVVAVSEPPSWLILLLALVLLAVVEHCRQQSESTGRRYLVGKKLGWIS